MDGLLIDSEPIYKMAWQAACNEHGFELSDNEHAKLRGRGRKFALQDIEKLAQRLGATFNSREFIPILNKYENLYFSREVPQKKLGVDEILNFLDDRSIPTAVATAARSELASKYLGAIGIVDRFKAIVGADMVARAKPFPDLFLKAHSLIPLQSLSPEKCLVLEDSEHGIAGAKAAGMMAIRIPDGITKEQIKESGADLLLDSLNDVISLFD